ncbi:MAG: hypothetical protein AVDCRST_MAG25-583, partial [uncultured Rubrobacteraceae bacterium]
GRGASRGGSPGRTRNPGRAAFRAARESRCPPPPRPDRGSGPPRRWRRLCPRPPGEPRRCGSRILFYDCSL